MSENDRLIPHDLFRSYRRRRQRLNQNEPSDDTGGQEYTELLVKEMLLHKLRRSRNKMKRRLDELKRKIAQIQKKERENQGTTK